ncbi:MAG TPA: VWA domain-containing protein, partial [Acidobacteriaceae bacterium]|nr:VWA domain-containing protein [Acidobacteriaceae bacterium]
MNRRSYLFRALALGIGLAPSFALFAQSQQAVPDAPAPQAPKPLSDVKSQVTPGIGSNSDAAPANTPSSSNGGSDNFQPPPAQPGSSAPSSTAPDNFQGAAPETPDAGQGVDAFKTHITVTTNAVEVPVIVKDNKGQMVAGLSWRDFRVFENNVRQRITFFTVDPYPLSMAYVIDQSVTADVMRQVNTSLGSIQGSLAPYDEVAVFTYNHGAQEATGFTGAQSHRLEAVLAMTHATGRDELVPVNTGALYGCPITSNGACVDPNIQPGRSAGGDFNIIPKELHTLNDAILKAAEELARRPNGRRRVIYVISDGKEYGSKATTKEVIHFLQANKIAVYGTLVGDSARWGEGYLSKFHVPFEMTNNVLLKYATETGGQLDAERNANGIEKSYQKLAAEARNQYTLVYNSHQPFIDGKYRSIEVRVDRPSVDVVAKRGYYPTS